MTDAKSLSAVVDRMAVEDTVVQLFVATDLRDWPTVQAVFANLLTLDMTSMVGGEPLQMTPEAVTDAWDAGFQPLDHVHHQVGNFLTTVNGDSASVRCHGVAYHHRSGIESPHKTRRFVGTYDIDLRRDGSRWTISLLRFNLRFIDGNLDLEGAE